MTFDEFTYLVERERQRGVRRFIIPVSRRLSADLLTPVSALLALRRTGRYPFLLESVEGGEKMARYSFLGRDPYRVIRANDSGVTIENMYGVSLGNPPPGNIFAVLQYYLDEYQEVTLPELPRLRCGAVGYLGYDGVRLIERLPDPPPDDLHLPEAIWCFYDTVAAFDSLKHQIVLMASVFVSPNLELRDQYNKACACLTAMEADLQAPLVSRNPYDLVPNN